MQIGKNKIEIYEQKQSALYFLVQDLKCLKENKLQIIKQPLIFNQYLLMKAEKKTNLRLVIQLEMIKQLNQLDGLNKIKKLIPELNKCFSNSLSLNDIQNGYFKVGSLSFDNVLKQLDLKCRYIKTTQSFLEKEYLEDPLSCFFEICFEVYNINEKYKRSEQYDQKIERQQVADFLARIENIYCESKFKDQLTKESENISKIVNNAFGIKDKMKYLKAFIVQILNNINKENNICLIHQIQINNQIHIQGLDLKLHNHYLILTIIQTSDFLITASQMLQISQIKSLSNYLAHVVNIDSTKQIIYTDGGVFSVQNVISYYEKTQQKQALDNLKKQIGEQIYLIVLAFQEQKYYFAHLHFSLFGLYQYQNTHSYYIKYLNSSLITNNLTKAVVELSFENQSSNFNFQVCDQTYLKLVRINIAKNLLSFKSEVIYNLESIVINDRKVELVDISQNEKEKIISDLQGLTANDDNKQMTQKLSIMNYFMEFDSQIIQKYKNQKKIVKNIKQIISMDNCRDIFMYQQLKLKQDQMLTTALLNFNTEPNSEDIQELIQQKLTKIQKYISKNLTILETQGEKECKSKIDSTALILQQFSNQIQDIQRYYLKCEMINEYISLQKNVILPESIGILERIFTQESQKRIDYQLNQFDQYSKEKQKLNNLKYKLKQIYQNKIKRVTHEKYDKEEELLKYVYPQILCLFKSQMHNILILFINRINLNHTNELLYFVHNNVELKFQNKIEENMMFMEQIKIPTISKIALFLFNKKCNSQIKQNNFEDKLELNQSYSQIYEILSNEVQDLLKNSISFRGSVADRKIELIIFEDKQSLSYKWKDICKQDKYYVEQLKAQNEILFEQYRQQIQKLEIREKNVQQSFEYLNNLESSNSSTQQNRQLDFSQSINDKNEIQLGMLGEGSFGKVYIQYDQIDNKLYAVKHISTIMNYQTEDGNVDNLKEIFNQQQLSCLIPKFIRSKNNTKRITYEMSLCNLTQFKQFLLKQNNNVDEHLIEIFNQMIELACIFNKNKVSHGDISLNNLQLFTIQNIVEKQQKYDMHEQSKQIILKYIDLGNVTNDYNYYSRSGTPDYKYYGYSNMEKMDWKKILYSEMHSSCKVFLNLMPQDQQQQFLSSNMDVLCDETDDDTMNLIQFLNIFIGVGNVAKVVSKNGITIEFLTFLQNKYLKKKSYQSQKGTWGNNLCNSMEEWHWKQYQKMIPQENDNCIQIVIINAHIYYYNFFQLPEQHIIQQWQDKSTQFFKQIDVIQNLKPLQKSNLELIKQVAENLFSTIISNNNNNNNSRNNNNNNNSDDELIIIQLISLLCLLDNHQCKSDTIKIHLIIDQINSLQNDKYQIIKLIANIMVNPQQSVQNLISGANELPINNIFEGVALCWEYILQKMLTISKEQKENAEIIKQNYKAIKDISDSLLRENINMSQYQKKCFNHLSLFLQHTLHENEHETFCNAFLAYRQQCDDMLAFVELDCVALYHRHLKLLQKRHNQYFHNIKYYSFYTFSYLRVLKNFIQQQVNFNEEDFSYFQENKFIDKLEAKNKSLQKDQ